MNTFKKWWSYLIVLASHRGCLYQSWCTVGNDNVNLCQWLEFEKEKDKHPLILSGANGKHISIKGFQMKGRKVCNFIPSQLAKARYCNLWALAGISFAISWWIIGKNGGQFLSLEGTPAVFTRMRSTNFRCKKIWSCHMHLLNNKLTSWHSIFPPFYVL